MKKIHTDDQKYFRAKKKVDNLKGFYSNLLAYCLVIPFLIFINLMTSPDHYWFWYPAIGWGIGIVFHAVGVFNHTSFFVLFNIILFIMSRKFSIFVKTLFDIFKISNKEYKSFI